MAANPMLNRSTRIGIAAMSALAAASAGENPALTAVQIAQLRRIPLPYLAKILVTLSRHGLIRGARGPGGGYLLARPPQQVTLYDIAVCFERLERAPLCPLGKGKPCDSRKRCPLHEPFQKMWDAQTAFLAETTLDGFADARPTPPGSSKCPPAHRGRTRRPGREV